MKKIIRKCEQCEYRLESEIICDCVAKEEFNDLKNRYESALSAFNNAVSGDEIETAVYLLNACESALNGFFNRIKGRIKNKENNGKGPRIGHSE